LASPERIVVDVSRRVLFIASLALAGAAHAQLAGIATREGVPTLAPLLEKVMPAVVNIAVLQKSPDEQNPLLSDPFFRRFFGGLEQARPQIAAGSGVIVDAKNGYVITNAHVVKDAREVLITLKDNRRLPAQLVGSDPGTDVALVKVQPGNLAEAKWGDSDALQVGDFVVAIGNPFGLGQTATSGIVSALGRSGLSMEGFEHFIQTDAPINPGNSGGALVNLKGELVGINSAIIGPAGGNVGIGFAVPSALARAVMDQLVRFGEVKRGRLGISMTDIEGGEGAQVAEVQPKSPAEQAGLREADVIIGLNGRPVRSAAELRARLGVVPVGETVELRVQRGKETHTVKAKIGEIEKGQVAGGESIPELAGASLAEVERRGLPGRNRAVLVTSVQQGSPASDHGLRGGDLIIGVNQGRVTSLQGLGKALRASGRVQLHVLRGDVVLNIPIK
jgi:serine protease Do/serine protease DegQ